MHRKTKTIEKYQCFKNQVTKNPEDEEGMQLAGKLGLVTEEGF